MIDSGGTYDGAVPVSSWIDIYIPANVNEIWSNDTETLNVVVNNTSKLVAYIGVYEVSPPLEHISGGLFKLVP